MDFFGRGRGVDKSRSRFLFCFISFDPLGFVHGGVIKREVEGSSSRKRGMGMPRAATSGCP